METKEYMENKKNPHDSSTLGDEQHCAMTPKSSARVWSTKTQGPPPYEHVPKCDIQCFTMEKNPQLIQKDFHKTLTNVKQYLKNTKEDAQIFSACTGSAWWEQIQAGTVEIGQEVSQKKLRSCT